MVKHSRRNYIRTDEAYYAGAALADTLLDPELTSSMVASQAAFGRSMRYDGTLWDWHREVSPEKSRRFGRGMVGYASMLSYNTILNGICSFYHLPYLYTHSLFYQGFHGAKSLQERLYAMLLPEQDTLVFISPRTAHKTGSA